MQAISRPGGIMTEASEKVLVSEEVENGVETLHPASAAADSHAKSPDERERADTRPNDASPAPDRVSALADLTVLAMQHPVYRNMAIADIDWLIMPALLTGNFAILHGARPDSAKVPLAAVTWARVSEEVDQRLMENLHRPFRLSPQEYVSGDIYWLAHTFGPPQMVDVLLKRLTHPGGKDEEGNDIPTGPLAGQKMKQRVYDDSGRTVVAMVE